MSNSESSMAFAGCVMVTVISFSILELLGSLAIH